MFQRFKLTEGRSVPKGTAKNAVIPALIFILALSFPFYSQAAPAPLSDEELLNTIQKQSFEYFWNERNPQNGLVRDRADNFRENPQTYPASIAATGFALTAYGVAASRDWQRLTAWSS